jgi:hypothetical protein
MRITKNVPPPPPVTIDIEGMSQESAVYIRSLLGSVVGGGLPPELLMFYHRIGEIVYGDSFAISPYHITDQNGVSISTIKVVKR